MTAHFSETDLALFVSGDCRCGAARWCVCTSPVASAAARVTQEFRADRERLRQHRSGNARRARLGSPGRGDDRQYSRLGLAAGECVAPRRRKSPVMSWRPAAIMAGAALMLAAGWWLNMPPSTTKALGRALTAVMHGSGCRGR